MPKKIFAGGLARTVTEDDLQKYFEQFGSITNVVIIRNQVTQRSRGFGYITFNSEDAVQSAIREPFHELNGKMVEVAIALLHLEASGTGTTTSSRYGTGEFSPGMSPSTSTAMEVHCHCHDALDRMDRIKHLDRIEHLDSMDRIERLDSMDRIERLD